MSIDAINTNVNEFHHQPMELEYTQEAPVEAKKHQYVNLNDVRQAVEMAKNGINLDDDDIDFETIVTDMAKLIIQGQHTREKHFFELSELGRSVWLNAVKRHAAEYSGTKWNIAGFPIAKTLLDVGQLGTIIYMNGNMKGAEPVLKGLSFVQSISETAKEYFATVDTGKRTELQAFVELSKLLFERNERENQNYSQQVQEAFRKYDEARRRRDEIEAAIARA